MNAFAEKFRHLSKLLGNGPGNFDMPERFREAADEIERLEAIREAMARALEAILEENDLTGCEAIARAALSKHRSGGEEKCKHGQLTAHGGGWRCVKCKQWKLLASDFYHPPAVASGGSRRE